ncbi:MAG TPA: PHP domain-containing protein [Candidatus Aenigmarchaeota archaeon]|nr:PHP domain-containing protein [Candidatus Aenigmarchaeota archaeon]
MRFELHCHTYYSKGKKIPWEAMASPEDAFKFAKKRGLSGIAITDHDTVKAWKEARKAARKYGLLFIPGIEITSSDGHILGLGLNEIIPRGLPLEETIDRIHEQGGIAIAAHPFDVKGEGVGDRLGGFDAVEVFNSMNLDRISNNVAETKAEKLGKPMVAGSDAHTKEMIGTSVNYIDAQNIDGVLKEIRLGRVRFQGGYVSVELLVDWARRRMIMSRQDIIRYVEENYNPLKAWISKKLMERFINSRSRFWYWLGSFGYSCSAVYNFFRLIRYY